MTATASGSLKSGLESHVWGSCRRHTVDREASRGQISANLLISLLECPLSLLELCAFCFLLGPSALGSFEFESRGGCRRGTASSYSIGGQNLLECHNSMCVDKESSASMDCNASFFAVRNSASEWHELRKLQKTRCRVTCLQRTDFFKLYACNLDQVKQQL